MHPNKERLRSNNHRDQTSNVKLEHVLDAMTSDLQKNQVETDIFQHLNVNFKVNNIRINSQQFLHTVYVETTRNAHKDTSFYLAHGFGGSSLMYFPIVNYLLEYGNVVLWEVRGMGFSKKLDQYIVSLQESEDFFVSPIDKMLKFYRHKQIYFISHSFGGYLTLLYILKYKNFIKNIKEVILLSPVGITPKEEDYKYGIKNFSDALHSFGNKISWTFHLTYKSPFRCICACLKNKVFKGAVQNCGFSQEQKILMQNLLIYMVDSSDGSENVFFDYFQPRVLPKFAIQPLFTKVPQVNIRILYGGEQDWVDKKGAQRIRDRFPQKVSLKLVKQCGHNFPFFPHELKKVLQQILCPLKSVRKESILMEYKCDSEPDSCQEKNLKSNQNISLEKMSEHRNKLIEQENSNSDDSIKGTSKSYINHKKRRTKNS